MRVDKLIELLGKVPSHYIVLIDNSSFEYGLSETDIVLQSENQENVLLINGYDGEYVSMRYRKVE